MGEAVNSNPNEKKAGCRPCGSERSKSNCWK